MLVLHFSLLKVKEWNWFLVVLLMFVKAIWRLLWDLFGLSLLDINWWEMLLVLFPLSLLLSLFLSIALFLSLSFSTFFVCCADDAALVEGKYTAKEIMIAWARQVLKESEMPSLGNLRDVSQRYSFHLIRIIYSSYLLFVLPPLAGKMDLHFALWFNDWYQVK